MSTIVTRAGKGSPLTWNEVDNNFTNLNTDKLQSGNTAAALTITSATINGGTITGTALNGTLGATTPSTVAATTISGTDLTTTGNTILGNASTDTLNVGNGGLVKDASGNVGIGTASPAAKLDVLGTIRASGVAATGSQSLRLFGTTTSYNYLNMDNTGATLNLGIEGSVGGAIMTGSTAYAGVLQTYSNTPLQFGTNGTIRATIDSSGNLGLGVTPSAWGGNYKVLQVPAGTLSSYLTYALGLHQNSYDTSGGSFKYVTTGFASRYNQEGGVHAWYTAPSGTAGNAITFTQAMTLDASGNFLVGTTSAFYNSAGRGLMELNGSSESLIALKVNDTATAYFNATSTLGIIATRTAIPLLFGANGAERMRLDTSGNLLVGTSSLLGQTSKSLVVNSSNSAVGLIVQSSASGDVGIDGIRIGKFDNNSTTSQIFVRFTINNQALGSGSITANGANACTFGSFSDERLKENIVSLPSQLENICSLRPVEFDYKTGGHQIGFIAQEMQNVYPDAVAAGDDEMLMIGGWSKTEARLVKAIQEQQAMIDELKAKVAALEAA
jgi:hypothetical protein